MDGQTRSHRTPNPPALAALLRRLTRPGHPDQGAWREFVAQYGPLIRRRCRAWKLQAADADDLTQQVLLKLSRKLQAFTFDPGRSFVAWLRLVTDNTVKDYFRTRRPDQARGGDDSPLDGLDVARRQDPARRLRDEFDCERLEQALRRVRQSVPPRLWEAFRLTALEGVPAAEAGASLQATAAAVYAARCRVLKQLRRACDDLEQSPPGPAARLPCPA